MNAKQILVAAVAAFGVVFSTSVFAHAKLEASEPKANSVVDTAPTVIRLQFNEPIELTFSKVKLLDKTGVAGAPLKLAIDKSNPRAMIATLPPLQSGLQRVEWTTVTRDGHKVKGELGFRIK